MSIEPNFDIQAKESPRREGNSEDQDELRSISNRKKQRLAWMKD